MDQILNTPAFSQSLKERYVSGTDAGLSEVSLSVSGIRCAGCMSGIERKIGKLEGLQSIEVNPSTHRARIVWDERRIDFQGLLQKFTDIGYPAKPYQARIEEHNIEQERRQALVRIVAAGALGMQIMMIATALYFGDYSGIDNDLRILLEYSAMVLTIPVILFCARPFFAGAWHNIKNRNPGMDVPVSLAILAAFAGSVWTTTGHPGHIYYESIAMFVFLLLSARFLELSARRSSMQSISRMEKSIPESACRVDKTGKTSLVDVLDLEPGDIVLVGPGETVPADGVVMNGDSSTNDAVITGESKPVRRGRGDPVVAGSINIENEIRIRVSATSDENVVNQIANLATSAQASRSGMTRLADLIASRFVSAVLLLALCAGVVWWFRDSELWLPVVISTLVVACPCALSLATPAAYAATMGKLTSSGIIPVRSDFLEDIKRVNHFVFDKTGTLTKGELSITGIETAGEWDNLRAHTIAASLNRRTHHPFARAFLEGFNIPLLDVEQLEYTPGGGMMGLVDGKRYILGSVKFVSQHLQALETNFQLEQTWSRPNGNHSISLLADESGVIARFELVDTIRQDARVTVSQLMDRGCRVSLLSGDDEAVVKDVADQLRISSYWGNLTPAQKNRHLEDLQNQGDIVAMVGDGLNDAPVLASASVSFAMGNSADLSKIHADVVLLNDRLLDIPAVMDQAVQTSKIIKQNLIWALAYNLLAIPAALTGLIPPWLAAIGMSTSSLIVSLNAMRLKKSDNSPGTAAVPPLQLKSHPA